MEELQLFPLVVEQANLSITRDVHGFWSLRIAVRFEGEPWRERSWTDYGSLSVGELADTLLMELHKTL